MVVVRTVIDLARYPSQPKTLMESLVDGGLPRVVRIRSLPTVRYLQLIREPLRALSARQPFVMRVIGGGNVDLPGVQVEVVEWTEATEIENISAWQVGVMPLLDSAWDHAQRRQVDNVVGAFFLVRLEIFTALRGFEERCFVYLEDLDFSYRACQPGWSSMYLANTQAFHAGGGTSNQIKARRLFYSLRSRLLYAFEHFSCIGAVGVLLATFLVEPLSRSALTLLRRSWAGLTATWATYGMLWRWLPRWVLEGDTR